MNIVVTVPDIEREIKNQVELKVRSYVDKIIAEKLAAFDFDAVILARVNYYVDKSKYLSENVIRNLVQQKIARELTDKILKS